MNLEQKIDLLIASTMVKSNTFTVPVAQTIDKGIKLGEGQCKAVILRLNNFLRNSTDGTAIAASYFYYGDAQKQERECLRSVSSDIIFCTDLNQVFVRNPFPGIIYIQVLQYK